MNYLQSQCVPCMWQYATSIASKIALHPALYSVITATREYDDLLVCYIRVVPHVAVVEGQVVVCGSKSTWNHILVAGAYVTRNSPLGGCEVGVECLQHDSSCMCISIFVWVISKALLISVFKLKWPSFHHTPDRIILPVFLKCGSMWIHLSTAVIGVSPFLVLGIDILWTQP
jgi:hypothetical protein